jgi:glycine oxidase
MDRRVTVVGGGVIGLSCAWRLAEAGHTVTLIAPNPGQEGASWVAAGMLAPVTEVQFGESQLTRLLIEGATHWPAFAQALEQASGEVIGYDQSGTLTVAANPSDAAALKDLLAYQQSFGLTVHPRSASQCRTLVPALSPMIGAGVEVPGDHQVDNRALLAALVTACQRHGVTFRRTSVTEVIDGPAVHLAEGGRLDADRILLAAGAGTPGIKGLDAAALPEIRPVKGHILRLAQGPNTVRLDRTVRALVNGRSVYLVPRADGSVVVGATVEERGDDLGVQAGAVHQLLSDARSVVPGVDEMRLLESSAGLRPATPDNIPSIGWTELPGVAAACGHYRNGILLAPYTASTIAQLLSA